MRGERLGECGDVRGIDREARRGPVAAVALEMLGARSEGAVEVERAGGAAGSLPVPSRGGAGDEDDGPAEALYEPRGDDADHTLVPVLAGDDIPAVAAPRLRPRLDLGDRGA